MRPPRATKLIRRHRMPRLPGTRIARLPSQYLDLDGLPSLHGERALEHLAGIPGTDGIHSRGEDVGRQCSDAFLDHLSLSVGHIPLRIGDGIPARACLLVGL